MLLDLFRGGGVGGGGSVHKLVNMERLHKGHISIPENLLLLFLVLKCLACFLGLKRGRNIMKACDDSLSLYYSFKRN